MENVLNTFKNNEFGTVRTAIIDNEVFFVGKDVAKALGYSNPQKALRDHIDNEDKTVNDSFTVNGTTVILINESGLYSLIISSKLPSAKKFKHWVTSEVLPSIRKHGIYATDKTLEDMLTDPDFGIRVLTELKKEREERIRAEEAKKIAEQKIEDDKPLVDFANHVNDTDTLITVGKMAKLLCDKGIDIGRNRLFDWMRDNGILMLDNTPYQRFINEGIFKVKEIKRENQFGKEFIYPTTYVTGKGQLWLYKKLVESMA